MASINLYSWNNIPMLPIKFSGQSTSRVSATGNDNSSSSAVMLTDNPYSSENALKNSCYLGEDKEHGLYYPLDPEKPVSSEFTTAHDNFKSFIKRHPCVGAKTAFTRKTYRFCVYPELGSAKATQGLGRDLYSFLEERKTWKKPFTTFVATFDGPIPKDEKEFEQQLWKQLSIFTALDRKRFPWSTAKLEKMQNGEFKFSFAGKEFFVVGLNPTAARNARNFEKPTLVFNLQEQFDQLRSEGKFDNLQQSIRKNEIKQNGSINPNLDKPDAAQYAGREAEDNWTPPLASYLLKPKKGDNS